MLYWSFLAIGYILSDRLRRKGIRLGFIDAAMMGSIYVMCFIMGLRMGVNDQVTGNLGKIGVMSLSVTVFCIAGSMGAIALTRKILGMNRYGDVVSKLPDGPAKPGAAAAVMAADGTAELEAAEQSSGDANSLDLKSTVIILILVAAGMVAGFIAAGQLPQLMEPLDTVTAKMLVVLLCILLFFVGFSLGVTGTLFRNIRQVGLKALAFPVAAILGSAIIGAAAWMVMGFSLK